MSTKASLATVCPVATDSAARCADNWITSEKFGRYGVVGRKS